MSGFQAQSLVSEAARNVFASRLRSGLLLGVAAGLTFAVSYAEIDAAHSARADRRAAVERGTNVYVVTSDTGQLPLAACDRLSSTDGVRFAGGVQHQTAVALATAPGVLVQTASVTPGVLSLWTNGRFRGLARGGWVVGSALAQELHLRAGAPVRLQGRDPDAIAAIVDPKPRDDAVDRWLMSVTPANAMGHECWAEFVDGTTDETALGLLNTTFSHVRDGVARRLFGRNDLEVSPAEELRSRSTALAWLPAAMVLALVLVVVARSRRAEIGLYRAVGAGLTDCVLLIGFETALLVVGGATYGLVLAAATAAATASNDVPADQFAFGVVASARLVAATLLLGSSAALLFSRDSIAAQLKDR